VDFFETVPILLDIERWVVGVLFPLEGSWAEIDNLSVVGYWVRQSLGDCMSDNNERKPEEYSLLKKLKDIYEERVGHETEERKSELAKRLIENYESWEKNPITLQEIRDKGYLKDPRRP
jgi:hypothetical protein